MKTLAPPSGARSRALTFVLLAALLLAPISTTGHVAASSCGDTYTVVPGDSVWGISATCGVPITTIMRLNRLGPYLQPGQVLQLTELSAPRFHVVRPADPAGGRAQRLGGTPTTRAVVRAMQLLPRPFVDARGVAPTHSVPAAASATTSGHICPSSAYIVRPGDTLWSIALAYHVAVAALATANGMTNPDLLATGITLCIPPAPASSPTALQLPARPFASGGPANTYLVRPGDTLSGIGQRLGFTARALAQANGLDLATPIRPGQLLHYPGIGGPGSSPAQQVGAVLAQQAAAVGVDCALLKAVAWRESNWRMVDAPDGGMGVMQLMPDTVGWLKRYYIPGPWDPHDLVANVHAGAVLLLLYSRLYGGDMARIVAAYHGGMGALLRSNTTAEMARYVSAVFAYRQAFLNGTLP
ncbi:MAG TPA: LysM peptidoglycan-binding domain-containing protein [Chloroflexota bacterium]|nr:LysM peptidoglycan-binding domain-containing protein [Chloroflexota bacterium]